MFCAGMFGALKPGFRRLATLKLVVNVVGRTLKRKEQLRHHAVSLRQHGFLVKHWLTTAMSGGTRLVLKPFVG